MLYELRIYYMHQGKMAAIHKRFSEVTLDLFAKHRMTVVDFWEDAEGKNTLYYILEHANREEREKNFAAFASDPDWLKAKSESEKDGPIVERVEVCFMTRVPYSPA